MMRSWLATRTPALETQNGTRYVTAALSHTTAVASPRRTTSSWLMQNNTVPTTRAITAIVTEVYAMVNHSQRMALRSARCCSSGSSVRPIRSTAFIAQAILAEASLSFLGLGVVEPTAAWGLMLSGNATDFFREAPWMILFPGAAISLAVFAFNLFGDSLRDFLDPRIRRGAGVT